MAKKQQQNQMVPYNIIRDLFGRDQVQSEIEKALPSIMTKENMIRIALTLIRSKPKLWTCSQESLLACLFGTAQLGLSPDPILGQVYWVPFWSKDLRCNEATLIPGYRGYIELGRRSGKISAVKAEVVYENDNLIVQDGLEEKLIHTPCHLDDRGELKGAWTVWKYVNGEKSWLYMPRPDILKIKEKTKSRDKSGKIVGPWITDESEMWKKCPIRRKAKTEPLSVEDNTIRLAASAEDMAIDYTPGSQRGLFLPEFIPEVAGDADGGLPGDISGDLEPDEFDAVFSDLIDDEIFQQYKDLACKNAKMSLDDMEKAAVGNADEFRKQFETFRKAQNKKKPSKGPSKGRSKTKKPSGKASQEAKGAKKADGDTSKSAKSEKSKPDKPWKMADLIKTPEHEALTAWQSRYPDVYLELIKEHGQPRTPDDCTKLTNAILDHPEVSAGGPPDA